jgi:hypothetical protein
MVSVHGEGVFEEAVVNTCSFQVIKKTPEPPLRIIYAGRDFTVDKSDWIDQAALAIEYRLTPESMPIVKKIRANSSHLSDFGTVIQGITPYDAYQGQSSDIIKNRAYHFNNKHDNTCGKWLEGTDVSRYNINWSGVWLSYGDWLAAPREKRFFTGERLLFREVPGQNKRIQATLTSGLYYYGHSISPFKPEAGYEEKLQYFLGIANSRLISWYGQYTFPNFGKEIYPKLNPNDIKEMPIPKGFKGENKIAKLVGEILETKKELPEANTIQLETEIDRALYKIYGLNEKEIKIVEGS